MRYERIQDRVSEPSPITHINVSNPNKKEKKEVKVIVDTGSGITCLPESVIATLGHLDYTVIRVRSPLDVNQIISTRLYSVRLEFGETIHDDIEVMGISKDYGIIGRDILNYHKIVLHAPDPLQEWWMNCSCKEGGCILSRSEQKLT